MGYREPALMDPGNCRNCAAQRGQIRKRNVARVGSMLPKKHATEKARCGSGAAARSMPTLPLPVCLTPPVPGARHGANARCRAKQQPPARGAVIKA